MRTMAAGEFKAKCLAVMDEVLSTGEPVLITKRGKPVARVVSPQEWAMQTETADSIFGFLRGMGAVAGDIVSSEFSSEEWERMADDKWQRIERENQR